MLWREVWCQAKSDLHWLPAPAGKTRELVEFIADIFESANRIRDYISGMTYEDFLRDLKTRDAVPRNLEVIGEASKYIHDKDKVQYPEIPWKEMAGMRDKLIHH